MSTDYKFYCEKCDKTGGGFSSQAWGTGNADIIDSFRFIMKHRFCNYNIGILTFDDYLDKEDDRDEDLLGYFPHSNEWESEENQREYNRYLEYCKKNRG